MADEFTRILQKTIRRGDDSVDVVGQTAMDVTLNGEMSRVACKPEVPRGLFGHTVIRVDATALRRSSHRTDLDELLRFTQEAREWEGLRVEFDDLWTWESPHVAVEGEGAEFTEVVRNAIVRGSDSIDFLGRTDLDVTFNGQASRLYAEMLELPMTIAVWSTAFRRRSDRVDVDELLAFTKEALEWDGLTVQFNFEGREAWVAESGV